MTTVRDPWTLVANDVPVGPHGHPEGGATTVVLRVGGEWQQAAHRSFSQRRLSDWACPYFALSPAPDNGQDPTDQDSRTSFPDKGGWSLRGSRQKRCLSVLRPAITSSVHFRILPASMLMGTSMPPCTSRAAFLEQLAQGERSVEAVAERAGLSIANASQQGRSFEGQHTVGATTVGDDLAALWYFAQAPCQLLRPQRSGYARRIRRIVQRCICRPDARSAGLRRA